MPVLPPLLSHRRAVVLSRPEAGQWRHGRISLCLGLGLTLLALLGLLLRAPADRPKVALSEAANRCAAVVDARQGELAGVGGFRVLPSSEQRTPSGFEADVRVRWNGPAGPNSGPITTLHCRVQDGMVTFTGLGRVTATR